VAPTVKNSGVIQANLGHIQLAAADTFGIDTYGDGLLYFAAEAPASGARTLTAENSGSLIADGGKVLMTAAAASNVVNSVINNKGVIQAKSLVSRNGEVVLTGAGANIVHSGTVD